jgi:hypothetical protein
MKTVGFMRMIIAAAVVPTLVLLVVTGCTTVSSGGGVSRKDLQPDPTLSPREVVAIQLDAFGSSEGDIDKIAVAFRFASPSNRAVTGPEERFAAMVKSRPYRIMLSYDRVEYAPVVIAGEVALQRVALFSEGEVAIFDFVLRRQSDDPYAGCWMTEGVTRFQPRRNGPSPGLPVPEVPEELSV